MSHLGDITGLYVSLRFSSGLRHPRVGFRPDINGASAGSEAELENQDLEAQT